MKKPKSVGAPKLEMFLSISATKENTIGNRSKVFMTGCFSQSSTEIFY